MNLHRRARTDPSRVQAHPHSVPHRKPNEWVEIVGRRRQSDVHAGIDQVAEHFGRLGGGAESGDDLGLSHGTRDDGGVARSLESRPMMRRLLLE